MLTFSQLKYCDKHLECQAFLHDAPSSTSFSSVFAFFDRPSNSSNPRPTQNSMTNDTYVGFFAEWIRGRVR